MNEPIVSGTSVSGINVSGITIPDSTLARDITQLIRDTESDLLFNHSIRVYFWAALAAQHDGMQVDAEML